MPSRRRTDRSPVALLVTRCNVLARLSQVERYAVMALTNLAAFDQWHQFIQRVGPMQVQELRPSA